MCQKSDIMSMSCISVPLKYIFKLFLTAPLTYLLFWFVVHFNHQLIRWHFLSLVNKRHNVSAFCYSGLQLKIHRGLCQENSALLEVP